MVDETHNQWKERGLRDAIMRGDREAWRVLYDTCFDSLYAFVDFRTGHCQERTEEVVQETWMVAVRRIRIFDPGISSFENWMRGISTHVIRNQRRKWKRHTGFEPVEAASREVAPGVHVELVEQIGLALTGLPARYQSVLKAKYEEKLSVMEIARRWKESPKAVESLLTRARAAFRELFAGLDR